MSAKSSATFERRFNDWLRIHPLTDYIGKDTNVFLSRQISRKIKADLESANRIVASQERIADRIDEAALGINRVSGGLESLRATFEWGFVDLVWQIEQTREVLQDILEVLQAPLDTQAKELRERGVEAYQNGWFDEALEDFLESEKKNRYDFTIHQFLGNIHLFHRKDSEKAMECYKKAEKYATPKSTYYVSYALLGIGLVHYIHGNFQEACESTLKAIKIHPTSYEAYYQHAQYCACLGKYDEAVKYLRIAIVEGDRYYCIKAESEKDFNVMKNQLADLFEMLRDETHTQAKNEINKAEELIQCATSYGISEEPILESREKLSSAKTFFKWGSYFDYLDAIEEAKYTKKSTIDSSTNFLTNRISETEKKIKKLPFKDEEPLWKSIPIAYFLPTLMGLVAVSCFLLGIHSWIMTTFVLFVFMFIVATCIVVFILIESHHITLRHEKEEYKLKILKKNLNDLQYRYTE